jgi:hypothetical protein
MGHELFAKPVVEGKTSNIFSTATFVNTMVFSMADDDRKLLSKRARDNLMGHFPAGTSCKSIEHFLQILKT